jgi:hypothetical protein
VVDSYYCFLINVKKFLFLFLSAVFFIGMGVGDKKYSTLLEPAFAPLSAGEGQLFGRVYDEKSESRISEMSFFGHTSVSGVRMEKNDSINRIELSKIREINIVNPNYVSNRYSDKDFVLADIVSNGGHVVEGLLIPKHVVICGLELDTKMEKAWFLGRISKVLVGLDSNAENNFQKNSEKFLSKEAVVDDKFVQRVDQKVTTKIDRDEEKSRGLGGFFPEKKMDAPKTVLGAFVTVVDSIIDFMKILLNSLFKFLGA